MADIPRRSSDAVVVRRGTAVLGRMSIRAIPERIKAGRLFGSDRISKDGKNWMRLDQHPETKKYFVKPRQTRGRGDDLRTGGLTSQVRSGGEGTSTGKLLGILIVLVVLYFLLR